MFPASLLLACWWFAAPLQDKSRVEPPDKITELKARIRSLKEQRDAVAARIDRLIRLRVAMDVALPVDEELVLEGTTPVKNPDPEVWKKAFDEASRRNRELRDRLAELYRGGGSTERLAASSTAPPPAPAGAAPVPASEPKKAAVSPPAPPPLPAPVRPASPPPAVAAPKPLAVDPLGDRKALARFAPSRDRMKRIASLLEVKDPKLALSFALDALEDAPKDAALLFLKARALERSGRIAEAVAAYGEVEEADTIVDAKDERKPGPWARAAALAKAHLSWRGSVEGIVLPDAKGLRW